jgi:cytoskeleton protein RodZ
MSIGNMLRERREELGWELPDVASYLRIRLPYLEAIEAEDYAKLPGSAFAIGFIRSYAHYLGFDSEKVLTQFRKDSSAAADRPALVMRVPIATSRAPTGKIVAAAALLIALIWILWIVFTPHDRNLAENVSPVPDRLKPVAAQTAPATAPVPTTTATTENDTDEAANDMQEPGSAPGRGTGGPFAIANSSEAEQAEAPAPGVNYGVPGTITGAVTIHAVDDAWVQVVDDTGASIFTGILHPGDTFPVPAGKAYTLTTGNAGGIELAVNGVAGQPLGETGRILRGVPLDPPHAAAPKKTP